MKKSPFHPGPLEDLTAQEVEAMSLIKQGKRVSPALCQRLELLDMAEESLCGWTLTPQGEWRLAQGR